MWKTVQFCGYGFLTSAGMSDSSLMTCTYHSASLRRAAPKFCLWLQTLLPALWIAPRFCCAKQGQAGESWGCSHVTFWFPMGR